MLLRRLFRYALYLPLMLGTLLMHSKPMQGARILKLKTIYCKPKDQAFVRFPVCSLKPVGRDVTEISVYAEILQKPVDNVTIMAGIRRRHGRLDERALLQFTIDGCKFFQNNRRNPLAARLYDALELGKYSNINHSCPYNHDIIFDQFRSDNLLMRFVPLPSGEYTFFSHWFAYNLQRASTSVDFQYSDGN